MIYDDNGSNTFFAILSALRIDLYDDRMRNILKIYYDAHLLFCSGVRDCYAHLNNVVVKDRLQIAFFMKFTCS